MFNPLEYIMNKEQPGLRKARKPKLELKLWSLRRTLRCSERESVKVRVGTVSHGSVNASGGASATQTD